MIINQLVTSFPIFKFDICNGSERGSVGPKKQLKWPGWYMYLVFHSPFFVQGSRVTKKESGSCARGCVLLVPDRPTCVTILSLGKERLRCDWLKQFGLQHRGITWKKLKSDNMFKLWYLWFKETTSNMTRHLKSGAVPLYHSLVTSLQHVCKRIM